MADRTTRRTFLKGTAAAVIGSGAAQSVAGAKNFGYFEPVFTTTATNVRDGAGTNYGVLATADKRTGGKVRDGPVYADGYYWWYVEFTGDDDNGRVTGWAIENNLAKSEFACPMTGEVTSTYWDCRPLGECDYRHRAVDIANGGGTRIRAARGGVADLRPNHDIYGNWIVIEHPNGWATGYGHLSSFAVSDGETVSKGQVIGYEGSTGVGRGEHLDFQVYDPNDHKKRSYYIDGELVTVGTGVPRNFF
jgi:murein DD-endopeptidase MepM/ murein hydrolase activator NlpD